MKTSQEIEFFLLKFIYNENVLVPRLETESLVRETLRFSKAKNADVLLDIWTWSGIIPVALGKNYSFEKIFALDISQDALDIARINSDRLNVNIEFIKSDLLEYIFDSSFDFRQKKVVMTANLPYIKDEDWGNMSEDTVFEPKIALFWWQNTGLELYIKFFKSLNNYVLTQFKWESLDLFIEFGYDQSTEVLDYFRTLDIQCKLFKDLRWIAHIKYR